MNKKNYLIYGLWLIALISTLGSLFFSEIMEFPPCVLCWYQRIAMYPLVFIFFVGAIKEIDSVLYFSAPLVVCGWILSVYHNLLHYDIIPESASPCLQGVSCSTVYINWFNFFTIPILSFIAFTILAVLLGLLKREMKSEK